MRLLARIFGVRRLGLPKPPCKRRVLELVTWNWIAQWARGTQLAKTADGKPIERRAITLPLPGFVLMLYLVVSGEGALSLPSPWTRFHEWCHVRQFESHRWFGESWRKYVLPYLRKGWDGDPLELQARAATAIARQLNDPTLPGPFN